MSQYILRDIPEGLWKRFTARAERDGWPLRILILQLLEDYATERVTPGGAAPMMAYAWLRSVLRALVLADPGVLGLEPREQWQQLRARIIADVTDPGRLDEFDAIDPSRRGAVLKWLERSLGPRVPDAPP